ncbi:hypothetical protein GA0074704_4227 [Micromonospora siamensis]|uniref:Uncharacterized protein n=1 Tax=Micromonospora siamensis TaxID=299152 RepID=A0A1C5J8D7_9ACTN|nr:hypothetical protein GA0074704_4227 [Micromonospora siamensis]
MIVSTDNRAKKLAKQEGIAYATALRLTRDQQDDERKRKAHAEMEALFPSLDSLLPEAVSSACRTMAGNSIGRYVGKNSENWTAGLTFDDVDLPTDILREMVIDVVTPDLDTINWHVDDDPDEQYPGSVEAVTEVTFTGWGRLAAVAGRHDLRLVDPDVDGNAEVTFTSRVRLEWHFVYHPGMNYLDLLYAGASELMPTNPHY